MKKLLIALTLLCIIPIQGEINTETFNDDAIDISHWSSESPEIQNGLDLDYLDIIMANYSYDTESNELNVIITFRGNLMKLGSLMANDTSIDLISYSTSFNAAWDCTTFNCDSESVSFDYFLSQEGVETYIDGGLVTQGVTINGNTIVLSTTLPERKEMLITRSKDAEYDYYFFSFQAHKNSSEFQDSLNHTVAVGNNKKWKVNAPYNGLSLFITLIPIQVLVRRRVNRKEN